LSEFSLWRFFGIGRIFIENFLLSERCESWRGRVKSADSPMGESGREKPVAKWLLGSRC
jgi:hypothetical protein